MILDSSAIVAVIRLEPEGGAFESGHTNVHERSVYPPPACWRRPWSSRPALDLTPGPLRRVVGALIEPVTESQARLARLAYRRYGRGTGHPARLNYGDCFSYALAMERMEPLLFKGNDFSQTDVLVAQ